MRLNITLHQDYTKCGIYYQLKLPFEIEKKIPANDPVRLLSAFVEGMDLSELYSTYGRIPKNQASPRQMLKVVIYAAMNGIYSSRDIASSCSRDINFMYLLEGMSAPDHSTIARFISIHLAGCSKDIFAESTEELKEMGEISGKTIFIDGTKIEANANKYTFVWKKAVLKNQQKLFDKIVLFAAECETAYGIKTVYNDKITQSTLSRLRKQLVKIKKEEGVVFVHGIGKKKSQIQKSIETLDEYLSKLKEYRNKIKTCGSRNSYSKTDADATFMRMKEDAMLNGQLKPAYNIQHGVDSQYITWVDISAHPTDTLTLIPFLKDMEDHLSFKYHEIVADAGYESEESYLFIEGNGQEAYIKPQNYEISKTRKYKQNPGRKENMTYNPDEDFYICKNNKKLTVSYERKQKTASGYIRTTTIYECKECKECPFKSKCIQGNNCKTSFEGRNKRLSISKMLDKKRQEDLERITSEYGTKLRMNRSIQAEGSFAVTKEDMGFRQYLYRGKESTLTESIIVAIAYNVNKLHFKVQGNRTGKFLSELKIA